MVFSSLIFLYAFLPITLFLYFFFNRFCGLKWGNIVLLLASIVFIWWGSGVDILVLLGIIFTNYVSGLLLTAGNEGLLISSNNRSAYQKAILIFCIAVNLGLLVYYKYTGFIAANSARILSHFGITWLQPQWATSIILPLGISFYTFQALSYTFDVYFGNVEATRNIFRFMLFVAFFPQLIAGPIVRYKDIYKQIAERTHSIDKAYQGTMRFLTGFSKKVLLANIISKAADGIFSLPTNDLTFPIAWLGVIAYALQIYFDFSAYSDMAIGLAQIMGFDLLENFNDPYCAKSIQEFWRRWHISLSTWFRDYLYIPLGGNRRSKLRTYLNMLVVFFLCGLWHGAAWTFIFWGLWHGLFLILERLFLGNVLTKAPSIFGRIYTILVVLIGWVLFRCVNMGQAMEVLKTMFGFSRFSGVILRSPFEYFQADVIVAVVLGILISFGFFKYTKRKIIKTDNAIYENILAFRNIILFLLCIASLYSGAYNPFIYFRF